MPKNDYVEFIAEKGGRLSNAVRLMWHTSLLLTRPSLINPHTPAFRIVFTLICIFRVSLWLLSLWQPTSDGRPSPVLQLDLMTCAIQLTGAGRSRGETQGRRNLRGWKCQVWLSFQYKSREPLISPNCTHCTKGIMKTHQLIRSVIFTFSPTGGDKERA